MTPEAYEFAQKYGGIWGEHPDWEVKYWQYEVADDNTRLGYWDWVMSQIQFKEDEE